MKMLRRSKGNFAETLQGKKGDLGLAGMIKGIIGLTSKGQNYSTLGVDFFTPRRPRCSRRVANDGDRDVGWRTRHT